ncbi:hypothetical protein BGZ46_006109 [Entomortierella lignicola]|nr:hypothetical protein BGZ46_006109 [Entomortierella lignicola]
MPKHLLVELKGRIVGAFEFGIPQADIARRYGLKTQTVSKVIEEFEKEGTVVPKKSRGRKPILTPFDVKSVLDHVKNNNSDTLQEITNAYPNDVSTRTIRRLLHAHKEIGHGKSGKK